MKVLLIEDHAGLREMVAEHLSTRGYAVDAVECGDDALAAAAAGTYDALILDLGLPDLDGMEVLARIRVQARHRGIPAVIVTARDSLDDRVRGLNAGADDYVVKPFELVELEARLRAVLRRPGSREVLVYSCGRLSFDPASREAVASGRTIALSRREAALLEELLRWAGRIVVKDALEDRLYSIEEDVSSNALEATVSRLRKKLEAAAAGVRVETRRNIGYRIVPEEPADRAADPDNGAS